MPQLDIILFATETNLFLDFYLILYIYVILKYFKVFKLGILKTWVIRRLKMFSYRFNKIIFSLKNFYFLLKIKKNKLKFKFFKKLNYKFYQIYFFTFFFLKLSFFLKIRKFFKSEIKFSLKFLKNFYKKKLNFSLENFFKICLFQQLIIYEN